MESQYAHGRARAVYGHSTALAQEERGVLPAAGPRLMRISEVDGSSDSSSPLKCIIEWIREFLARPHPQVGRSGSVCPFVPTALKLDTLWLAEVAETAPSFERISEIITEYRNVFLRTEPTSSPEAMNKAFLVVFSSLANNAHDGATVIDKVQLSLKKDFVEIGLMLGEFHSTNESPGLRNPDFRPLRSPIPMLAIRHMVESDLPFLIRQSYPPKLRSSFLRSYLFRMGGILTRVKFDEALDGLVAAEVAITSDPDDNSSFIVCPV